MINDPILINDWHPVAAIEQLEAQNILAARLLDEDIVLWRVNGETLAWQDLCIHRGTRLSLGKIVEEDKLECPYHGWTYNREGRCVRIPAHPGQVPPLKAVVKSYKAKEQYGLIWVSLGEPAHDVPPFPQWADSRFRKVLWGPYRDIQASGPRIIENFLDVAHLPFVHEGILGDKSHPEIEEYEAEVGAEGVKSGRIGIYQPSPFGDQGGTVYYSYSAFRPLTAHFLKESAASHYAILLMVTPQAEVESTAWMWIATTHSGATEPELRARLDEIFGQDRPIVASQRPELLPLDLQAELHLRSDRMAIAYRKWLRELGLTFGTA